MKNKLRRMVLVGVNWMKYSWLVVAINVEWSVVVSDLAGGAEKMMSSSNNWIAEVKEESRDLGLVVRRGWIILVVSGVWGTRACGQAR